MKRDMISNTDCGIHMRDNSSGIAQYATDFCKSDERVSGT